MTNLETLASCIHTLAELAGKTKPQWQCQDEEPTTTKKLLPDIGKHYDVKLSEKRTALAKVPQNRLPLIFCDHNGHYTILAKMNEEQALIQSPFGGQPGIVSLDELAIMWGGTVVFCHFKQNRFDIRWFIPEFLRYRSLLGKILVFSLMLQLLALISPLFFQVVMDKVLVHSALSTLDVLVSVLVIVGIYEVVLRGLREYLFAHTTNRIDIRLGAKLFNHLLSLPLLYFKSRQVGTIVARVRELDSIREFLTSSAMTLGVDVAFSFVFFAVMRYLSSDLAILVLATLPFYFFLAWGTGKRLNGAVEHQFQCSAKNTSFMTESVAGIQTLKSLAIEPMMQRRWHGQVEEFVGANLRTQTINNLSTQSVQLLQKVTSAVVIWYGATLVMKLEITIGQLIAFNMLLSHVHQPLGKLVDLWQQYIQTRVGVEALGDMLNLPGEQESGAQKLEGGLKGKVAINHLIFRYSPDADPVLKGINLDIAAGESIGIVGPSGSGKSTITRVIQKLYLPEAGEILIDDIPLNDLSATELRSQIGVVLQENYLFNRTVRDNIALKDPSAEFDAIVNAAKLAGAHDFILKLPMGYDTVLSEGGTSLSGGQRQRVAIARALLGDPKILILDEATSALDDESQEIIQKNMAQICQGRTVITIAHRLSTVRGCNRIITVEAGMLTESGSHEALLEAKGTYSRLWQLQTELKQEETI
ncbi:type I secretion system permease/ATPase [Vibrio sp. 10N.261.52.A1]|uniref:peptidase domain-containing ABC transporter n=1 Tax=Vibrio sp. 10N.261.52.A1 TaxID=1880849 RepID=UPI000C84F07A|nr:type I secretion system permease/ATPase [Vibrio sp. 10N.261.52.A1]PML28894.1 peptidase C39 [Vibrio sp. 10N.261.52.A1]